MAASRDLVVGVDIGGTSITAVLAGPDGSTTARARGEGANPNSHPVEIATARLVGVLRELLGEVDPHRVRGGVLGIAGVSRLSDPIVAAAFQQAWRSVCPDAPMRALSDVEAAFAAGTPIGSGVVLVAGTGAIAARIEDNTLDRTAGGHGWLLGDEGSAFWLGREAVRHTLRAVEGRDHCGVLARRVLDAAEVPCPRAEGAAVVVDAAARRRLISVVGSAQPVRLAEYAPLVSAAHHAGDPAAVSIVRRGAAELADLVRGLRTAEEKTPVILAGSLLTSGSPIEDRLRVELAELAANDTLSVDAFDPASGAAWLAIVDSIDDSSEARLIHRRLTSARPSTP
ncbi:N-acetylglucosamine kinase [Actinoalloteichus hymeniacidonis]|uniref:N-acetylglucosamine kinase n=1 Tax=Actinoalloteichus hymeniacidonis TaxID=340345 RepID=A0AAC9MVJ3_9PSEU|nr:BadF/BadG/BcrA/BcrD ATPase family protein [Actinoalloteichus hymeniacidonis]AOS61243.1 putative N-acetylglucosamine kinase [Actinoalloteichus hymeniacidonis]MBB5910754.1 N-acetylglucosamine kinase-like BadF-type ATPase [Actinoalloteichus hymeniacidonis]